MTMSEISIPTTLNVLTSVLRGSPAEGDLRLPLRALQFRGLSKLDLVVFVERVRERNAATDDLEHVEENCLLALDIIHGAAGGASLSWNAQHDAASLVARCLDEGLVRQGLQHGLEPSDLLPPRGRIPKRGRASLESALASATIGLFDSFERLPAQAEIFRVPKGPFTTRPAALMAIPDRLTYEALAGVVETAIADRIPPEVLWPRRRSQQPDRVATSEALSWGTPYIAKADISNFYEAVDHSLLAVFLISYCELNVIAARAIEALLTSTMGIPRGLPQGPPGSDVLASAYLLPLDAWLRAQGVGFVRYADDYFFGVESVGAGKDLMLRFEGAMRELGLALNTSKTQVMRRDTFIRGLERPSPEVLELRQELAKQRVGELKSIDDGEKLAEALEAAGVDEETLFDLVYHRRIELDDVLEQFADRLLPSLVETYETYLRQISLALERGVPGELGVYARLTREALRVLTLAEADVEAAAVHRVVTWFPQVAPLASDLIAAGARRNAAWARSVLYGHLSRGAHTDWVDAWMIHSVTVCPDLADDDLLANLRSFARGEESGPLTRLESVRALSAVGALDEGVWREAFSSVSVPLQSEMVFSALANARRYPWLVGAGAVQERRVALAVQSLEVGTGRDSRPN